MTNNHLREAPLHSMKNRKAVEASVSCGCYHCLTVFSTGDITEWTDKGTTALCPHCHVDCVIPQSSGIPLDQPTLEAIKKHWFGK